MNCANFRQQLEALVEGHASDAEAMRAHARECESCARQLALEHGLRSGLRELAQPPEHDPRRTERLLAPIRQQERAVSRRGLGIGAAAAAACLTLGVMIGMMLAAPAPKAPGAAPERTIALDAARQEPVRLVFRSPSDLQGARIHLLASEGVELLGYPEQRELSWSADLRAGANLLELPVALRGAEGTLVATITHGEGSRSFTLRLQPKETVPGASLQPAPLPVSGRLDGDHA